MPPQMILKEETSTELQSRMMFLNKQHNIHMDGLMSCIINLRLFKDVKDDEIVGQMRIPVPGVEGGSSLKQVTAKEQKNKILKKYNQTVTLLKAIEAIMEEEGQPIEKGFESLDQIADVATAKIEVSSK